MIDPQPDFTPAPGVADPLEPGVRRILAPNPSPMTFRGTNTYLVGTRGIAVIDPGPDDSGHLDRILAALEPGQHVSHIFVTHAHLDHSPLARPLAARTGAPILGFGPATAGRSQVMHRLASQGLVGGGEGVDHAFTPDVLVADEQSVDGDGWSLKAVHTPGHMANHLSFALGDVLFSGDLVMGWATSLVSPPDGDLTDFMTSLRRLQSRPWRRFHPGHGAPIDTPEARLSDLLAHRLGRERAILTALESGPATAASLAARIYTQTPTALLPAAERNVLSHLIDLTSKNSVTPIGELSAESVFSLR
ncbi:MBL fold metallo-hydrolase [Primorskyibacter sp. 2E107]|uniref:MBL fold metallo-hydrolase n=1 Tax=Primorskyibacter sp. 2E107 TaxID=3403458 RepID=UPI003AF8E424